MSVKPMPLETVYGNEVKRAEPANPPKESVTPEFRNARRIQESLTSGLERKVLLRLAERMPAWVNSDHLTLLGFAATFLACASYVLARWNRAGLLLATLWKFSAAAAMQFLMQSAALQAPAAGSAANCLAATALAAGTRVIHRFFCHE